MARLNKTMDISEDLLDKLEVKKIFSVLDFLQEDIETISSSCNVSFKEVLDLRHKLTTSFSALPVSGCSAYEHLVSSSALISSGIPKLDDLLHGGLLTGTVLEICGLSGDGSSQLCYSVAAHIAGSLHQAVHYVDTNNQLSATRLSQILSHKNLTEEEAQSALERISVFQMNDIYQLLVYLHNFKTAASSEEDTSSPVPRVIFIDSMPPLYMPFMSSESTQGLSLLNNVMATMKTLATDHQVLFIVLNLATTVFEAETVTVEDAEADSEVRPMLGKYWLHAPTTRLLMSRLNNEAPQRILRVTKSTYLPVGASCVLTVTHQGVE